MSAQVIVMDAVHDEDDGVSLGVLEVRLHVLVPAEFEQVAPAFSRPGSGSFLSGADRRSCSQTRAGFIAREAVRYRGILNGSGWGGCSTPRVPTPGVCLRIAPQNNGHNFTFISPAVCGWISIPSTVLP